MRGTTASFWKKYERQQIQLVKNCMPRTAAGYGPFMVPVRKTPATPAQPAKQA